MALTLKEGVLAKAAILGVLCAMVNACSTGGLAQNCFSLSIRSRRNSTGYRHIRATLNTPQPLSSRNVKEDEILFDIEHYINTVENRKIVQLITSIVVDEKRVPPPGYEHVAGVGWYRLHLKKLTWEEARLACEAEGAHLAVLNSQDEANALNAIHTKAKTSSTSLAFLGFSDLKDGRYRTIFGETLEEAGFASWYPGLPNNPDEHCGTITRPEAQLSDIDCNSTREYFCEFQP